jgi:hypothetical protein
LSIFSLNLEISGKSFFTERSLKFLEFPNRSPGPPSSLLLPRARALLCPPLPLVQCVTSSRRSAAAAAPPPTEMTSRRPSPPAPALFPFLAALLRAHHGVPSHPPAATSSPPHSVLTPTCSPLLFCPTEPGDHSDTVCTPFPLAVHTPSSNRLRRPLLFSGEPQVTVDSHYRAPIASTDHLAGFPNLYSCFPATSRNPI